MVTKKIVVTGLVQGIGFRPFVAELAEKLNITGWVRNSDGIVTCQVSGDASAVSAFTKSLRTDAPPGAWIEQIKEQVLFPEQIPEKFSIIESLRQEEPTKQSIVLPADLPTCERCESELRDPFNRRFRHPFISCTSCGPRYSILEEIPYDRLSISMKRFLMCEDCKKEYNARGDVRRHAQTIACKACGPTLTYKKGTEAVTGNEQALTLAIDHLKVGGILAVKDIGGYHLAADPFCEEAVKELRRLKGRENKPFAVLFADPDSVRKYCEADADEEALLLNPARPIVLLKQKKTEHAFCPNVCGNSPDIGAMLPCNPVQILLSEACGPLIMTSANITGELITTENEQMEQWLVEDSVAVLSHDRPIVTPLDDSIVRIVCGKRQTLRRARGMVPTPIPFPMEAQVLAAGGDLKACFCYVEGKRAYLSQHLGDLAEESCFMQYQKEQIRMKQLFHFHPKQVICDLHPLYRSKAEGAELIQHHKAHVLSVVAEHDLCGRVLGFAFDGTGYGEDGSIWGSEVFLWDEKTNLQRVAHLSPVKLIGGDEGAKNADTILYGYLHANELQPSKMIADFDREHFQIVAQAIRLGINTVTSTSMGRLFDAVSALLDICHYNSYEGEAAIELENLAATVDEAYELSMELIETGDPLIHMDTGSLFEELLRALEQGNDRAVIARGFLYALADAIVTISQKMRGRYHVNQIALSGGTFLNRILLERVTALLEENGFLVYRNELVPPGDGGLCLGQAYSLARGKIR